MNAVISYPYFYPKPEWLKLAALRWDKVYTLMPSKNNRSEFDPPGIQELDFSLGGILDSVDVAMVGHQEEVRGQFTRWLDARADRLKAEEWISQESNERKTLKSLDNAILESRKFFPRHGITLLEELEKRGLARSEVKTVDIQVPKWRKEGYFGEMFAKFLEGKRVIFREIPPDPFSELIPFDSPKPGSDHEKYEQLKGAAREKRLAQDFKGADVLERAAEKIWQQNLITVQQTLELTYLPGDIALHYLSLCASKAAVDEKRDLVASGEKFTDIVFHDFASLRGEVTKSVLQAYLPENFFSLEPRRVAEFRVEFATQRLKYQKEIQSIVDEFASVASEGQLENVKKSIVALADEQIEDVKKTYQRAKVGIAMSSLGLSLAPPALAASIASILGIGIFAPAGIAAALSIFAVTSLLDWDKAKAEKAKSPWSYVLDLAKI